MNKCLRDLRESMAARGWVENPDLYSPYYDFRWTIKSKDVIFSEVLDHQMVNHFSKNTIITTKSGLAKSLRMVNCFHDVDDHSFFPLCFNLETDDELKDFELEYRFSYVQQS